MRGLALDRAATHHVRLRDDLARPEPGPGEVLVRVSHATVNGHEFELATHPLTRLLAWVKRAPGLVRTGLEFAGTVESDGGTFHRGDAVMGYVDMVAGWRPHAEFVAIPEDYIAAVPAGVTLERASTLPMSGLTALAAVRDIAQLGPGRSMLLLGASGGVGVLALQIARKLGASTTALASARHHKTLRRLGATETVDYRETPVSALEGSFDAVVDFSATLRHADVKHLLAPAGVFVPADPIRNLGDVVFSRATRWLMVDRGDGPRLRELGQWVADGDLELMIDEVFAFSDWERAVERGHTRGRIGRTVLAFD
jgi:NADPH:quinone reductase-like Zn-dependent oxidoreductase